MDKVLKKRAETEGKPAANPKFLWTLMDKVLKKRAETEGKPAANPKFLWPKRQFIKLKLSQSASALRRPKTIVS